MLKISSTLIFLGVSSSILGIPVHYSSQDDPGVSGFDSDIAVSDHRNVVDGLEGRNSASCVRKQLHNILAHDTLDHAAAIRPYLLLRTFTLLSDKIHEKLWISGVS